MISALINETNSNPHYDTYSIIIFFFFHWIKVLNIEVISL